jgi:hypothetical protein
MLSGKQQVCHTAVQQRQVHQQRQGCTSATAFMILYWQSTTHTAMQLQPPPVLSSCVARQATSAPIKAVEDALLAQCPHALPQRAVFSFNISLRHAGVICHFVPCSSVPWTPIRKALLLARARMAL